VYRMPPSVRLPKWSNSQAPMRCRSYTFPVLPSTATLRTLLSMSFPSVLSTVYDASSCTPWGEEDHSLTRSHPLFD